MRQAAHLRSHHGKALAHLAGPGRLYPRVQRQEVGLFGNVFNHSNDLGNLVRAVFDILHGGNGLLHHLPAFLCIPPRNLHRGRGLPRGRGRLGDRNRKLVDRRRSAGQGLGGAFRTLRQIPRGRRNLRGAAGNGFTAQAEAADRMFQAFEGGVEIIAQLGIARAHLRLDATGQIPLRQLRQPCADGGDGRGLLRLMFLPLGPCRFFVFGLFHQPIAEHRQGPGNPIDLIAGAVKPRDRAEIARRQMFGGFTDLGQRPGNQDTG